MLGYSNESSFSQILNGKKTLPITFADRLLAIDESLSKEWLLTGKGEMLKDNNSQINESANKSDTDYTDIIQSQQRTIETLSQTIASQQRMIENLYSKKDIAGTA